MTRTIAKSCNGCRPRLLRRLAVVSLLALDGLLFVIPARGDEKSKDTATPAPIATVTDANVAGPNAGNSPSSSNAAAPSASAPIPASATLVGAAAAATAGDARFSKIAGHPGFWRIARTRDGIWWFLNPSGSVDFLNTVTTVQPVARGRSPLGPDYVSSDFDEADASPAAMDRWAKSTIRRVGDAGFKGIGAWSSPVLHNYDVPMTQDLNLSSWTAASPSLIYSPAWTATIENAIKTQVEPLRLNHNLVGYYLDNEMSWDDESVGPRIYFDGLTIGDPNRREVLSTIHSNWSSVEEFNKDWHTQAGDWKAIESLPKLPQAPAAYDKLLQTWIGHVAESYFRTTTVILHKYDPNHLVLGIRYRGNAPVQVVRASRNYTDAQSLNYYVSDARLDPDEFKTISQESDQPIVISEYSFHALDGRSGNRNTVGFTAQVLDQKARADGYRDLTTRLARVPYVIGADWFQWMDEPPSGRHSDGEDANFGVVDIDDRPYEQLVDAIRSTTSLVNSLHESSEWDKGQDIWRDSFANRPAFAVPMLDRPIHINGELSDWPVACKVPGIRPAQAVGTERFHLPEPSVYLGWARGGITLAFEVYDNDVSAAPAMGNWWSRDSVEFWISTRPVTGDMDHFNEYCHHFFFVPVDQPGDDGVSGVVGQWHSPGDAVGHPIVPHPDIRSVTRILPDRYVTEIFIPASALHGYDPLKQPQMAFNIQVRNYQHAAEYFWSAPKQVLTQARPGTWGTIYLTNPSQPKDPRQPQVANIATEPGK